MVPSINIASVVSVEIDGAAGLFVVDYQSGKVHRLSATESDPVESGKIMMAIMGHMRQSLPTVPRDQVADVMAAEKDVMESAYKSVEEGQNKEM